MNRIKQIGKYVQCGCFAILLAGRPLAQSNNLQLRFVNKVGTLPVSRDSLYTNNFGEAFTIRQFKYYISHLQAMDSSGRLLQELSAETFLIDASDSTGNCIQLPQLNARARQLRFLIGVDSSKNVSGVHTGALDPARGMFWTWNSGYIMAKLEGKSAASRAPGNYFTYHIGGYKTGQATARNILLPLPEKRNGQLVIIANALQWFSGVHDVRIGTSPVCHEPGDLAVQLADNFATMFSLSNQ